MTDEERLYKLDNGSDTARWAAEEIRRLREEKEADKAAYEVALAENRRLKAVEAKVTDYHVHSWKQSLDGVTMICDCGAWK